MSLPPLAIVYDELRRLSKKVRRALVGLFFFSSIRRHTMSLRDWSSDVCSSDLSQPGDDGALHTGLGRADRGDGEPVGSEERRVGKECRSRWSRVGEKKNL